MFGRWRGLTTPRAAAVDAVCLGFFSEYITCTVVLLSPTLEVEKQKVPTVELTVKFHLVTRIPLPGPRLEGVA